MWFGPTAWTILAATVLFPEPVPPAIPRTIGACASGACASGMADLPGPGVYRRRAGVSNEAPGLDRSARFC